MAIIHRLEIIKIDYCEGDSLRKRIGTRGWPLNDRELKNLLCAKEGRCVKNPKRSSYIYDIRT